MNFKQFVEWGNTSEEEDAIIKQVGSYIMTKVNSAAGQFALWRFMGEGKNANPKGKMLYFLRKVWPENDGRNAFSLPKDFDAELHSKPITFTYGYKTFARTDPKQSLYGGINIDLGEIETSKNMSELRQHLDDLLGKISHEPTHIFFSDDATGEASTNILKEKTPENVVTYFTNPAEVRSHAQQFAVLYDRYHPNQPIIIDNLLKIAKNQPKKSGNRNAWIYFYYSKIPPYNRFPELAKAAEIVLNLMSHILKQPKG